MTPAPSAPSSGWALGPILLAACSAGPGDVASPPPVERAENPVQSESALTAPTTSRPLRSDGLLPGMARFRSGPPQAASAVCANPGLSYFGGPVLQNPTIVAVFWSSSVNATLQANIGQFYADVTKSSYWSWLEEYSTVGLVSGTGQAILPGTFGGAFTISALKCNPGASGCKLTDTDIQSELARQIDLGVLPAPVLDCIGSASTVYMVDFPPNISLTGPSGTGRSCVANGFCAYHNTGTYGTNATPLVYAALMDLFTGGCATGCGGNATRLDDATDVASHELTEAVTDPDVGLDTQTAYAAPAAWGDNGNQCGEIADICDDGSPGDTITVSGRTWVVQQLWSDKQGKCTSTGPAPSVCSGTTVTNCRKCSCGDNGGACSGSKSVCETTSSNVLYGACEQCTATSGACTGGMACGQSTTPSQDDVCPCTPATMCPAGDDCGTVPDGCGGTVSCGSCTLPATCGGGTAPSPNVCGCTPATTCPAGDNCGTAPNGCGAAISCGTCGANQTCSNNHCVAVAVDAGSGDGGAPAEAGVADSAPQDSSGAVGSDATAAADGGIDAVSPGDPGSAGDDASATSDGEADAGGQGGAGASPGSRGGCGCRTAESRGAGAPPTLALGGILLLVKRRQKKRTRAS